MTESVNMPLTGICTPLPKQDSRFPFPVNTNEKVNCTIFYSMYYYCMRAAYCCKHRRLSLDQAVKNIIVIIFTMCQYGFVYFTLNEFHENVILMLVKRFLTR